MSMLLARKNFSIECYLATSRLLTNQFYCYVVRIRITVISSHYFCVAFLYVHSSHVFITLCCMCVCHVFNKEFTYLLTYFKVTDFGTNRKLIYDFLSRPQLGKYCSLSLEFINLREIYNVGVAQSLCSLQTFTTRHSNCKLSIVMALSTTFTQCAWKLPNSVKITQSKGHFAIQGHSRSPILVPIESSYTTSYQ